MQLVSWTTKNVPRLDTAQNADEVYWMSVPTPNTTNTFQQHYSSTPLLPFFSISLALYLLLILPLVIIMAKFTFHYQSSSDVFTLIQINPVPKLNCHYANNSISTQFNTNNKLPGFQCRIIREKAQRVAYIINLWLKWVRLLRSILGVCVGV